MKSLSIIQNGSNLRHKYGRSKSIHKNGRIALARVRFGKKNNICKHVLAMMCRFHDLEWHPNAKDVPLGANKRKKDLGKISEHFDDEMDDSFEIYLDDDDDENDDESMEEITTNVLEARTQHNDETGSSDRHDFVVTGSDNEENIDPIVVAKKRGRPAGSKNKPKDQS
ncbi:hypothetical protein BpHYR1_015000, partial [Brachionus plicatilis]